MLDASQIDRCFPHQTYRDGQREAIEKIVESFQSGKRIYVLEAPTGAGKSAIGMTLANMCTSSYYLTITKILQDQLLREFSGAMVDLRGRSSYPCDYWDRRGPTMVANKAITQETLDKHLAARHHCGGGFCRTDAPTESLINNSTKCKSCFLKSDGGSLNTLPSGRMSSACAYYDQVNLAIGSPCVSMNFAAFLNQTQHTNRFDAKRELMIIDETHNCESVLMDFITLSLDDRLLQPYGLRLPEFETAVEYAIWYADHGVPRILSELESAADQKVRDSEPIKRKQAVQEHDELKTTVRKFCSFMKYMQSDSNCEWVAEHTVLESSASKSKPEGHAGQYCKVELKPVYIKDWVESLLLSRAEKVLMMSATILDTKVFVGSLGLSKEQTSSKRMRTRFPVEAHPIFFHPVAKVTGGQQHQHEWGPAITEAVNDLCRQYPDNRGIIHTHNFAIANMLLEYCAQDVACRFTFQNNYPDKWAMLKDHGARDNSVIVAPAMHEGIDLPNDLSRFQVIAKVPYPGLDSKQLRRRIDLDPEYYQWLTALKLVQSVGRSIRSETDYADTYVLDTMFREFYRRNSKVLPNWFRDSIRWDTAQAEVMGLRPALSS